MTTNKGGRPAHHQGETKKAAIAVRTAPSIRDALKRAADAAGRSVTQEVEARLAASLEKDAGDRTPETEQLLNRIGAEISEIEGVTGRRWHRDRRTAGAVLELLEKKPPHWIQTDDPYEDEIVEAAWKRLQQVRNRQSEIAQYMSSVGIKSEPDQNRTMISEDFLKVASISEGTPMTEAVQTIMASRWSERAQLAKLELPKEIREATTFLISELERADREWKEADAAYGAAIQPYIDAELEGRAMYRDMRFKKTLASQKRGADPDYADWMVSHGR